MKQVIQSLADGRIEVLETPVPAVGRGALLIQTDLSLISAGTERMLLNFGRANLLNKARQQPDKVRQVLEKVRTDGLAATLASVRSKLDQPIAPGYCNVGRVVEVGSGVNGFSVGDLVVSNGPHAQFVSVPQNLCARVPEGVATDTAVFTVLSAIALQGMRLAKPTLGECFVVIGLGLIGQLATQILRAQGCRVLGVDFDDDRLALARGFGAETVNADSDVLAAADSFSRRRGVDGALICAATSSDEPVRQAARMCRKRGRIVLVGVAGLTLSRDDFFQKELSFQVSCSYGPGRYDPDYEAKGRDYPVGFVRWTEQRNFEAVLDLMAAGSIETAPLVSQRYSIEAAKQAYDELETRADALGLLLEYPASGNEVRVRRVGFAPQPVRQDRCRIVALGAGNYASRVLLPAMIRAGCEPAEIVSAKGVSAAYVARKLGFADASTDDRAALARADADTVIVATRHDSHSRLVREGLQNGKHVFCEKPLCLTTEELADIDREVADHPNQLVMVGFNRRFSPLSARIKSLLDNAAEPKAFIMTVNAGEVPADHWVHDREAGGGRIIGEACHFVDLLRYFAGSAIEEAGAMALRQNGGIREDRATLTLRFACGSIGTIHYLANGNGAFPKERLEIFTAGKILQLDNWRSLQGFGWSTFKKVRLRKADKGVDLCCSAFVDALKRGGPPPIPWPEIHEVSRVSIELAEMLR